MSATKKRRRDQRRLHEPIASRGVDSDGVLRVFECVVGKRTVDELVAGARRGDPYDVAQCLAMYADIERGEFPGLDRSPAVLRDFALDVLDRLLQSGEPSARAALGLGASGRPNEDRKNWNRDWDLAASVRELRAAGKTLQAARLAVTIEKGVLESKVDRALRRFPEATRLPRKKGGRS